MKQLADLISVALCAAPIIVIGFVFLSRVYESMVEEK